MSNRKKSWVEEKFGKPCERCGKRHDTIATIGENVASGSKSECDGKRRL